MAACYRWNVVAAGTRVLTRPKDRNLCGHNAEQARYGQLDCPLSLKPSFKLNVIQTAASCVRQPHCSPKKRNRTLSVFATILWSIIHLSVFKDVFYAHSTHLNAGRHNTCIANASMSMLRPSDTGTISYNHISSPQNRLLPGVETLP